MQRTESAYSIVDRRREQGSVLQGLESCSSHLKILCNGDWIGQLNYLTQKGWVISKFMLETESKYRELDDYGKALKHGIGWYDIQTQCILLKKPLDKL